MTTPTLAERLAQIGARIDARWSERTGGGQVDVIWMHRILTRLGDEKVVNETAIAIGEVVMRKGTLGEMARAALAAARRAVLGHE